MREKNRKLLYVAVVALLGAAALMQTLIEPGFQEMNKAQQSKTVTNSGQLMVQLPGQFLVATFAGFKEVIASSLWVRADEFFHQGMYPAILPIVRMVTWLDPHNIDVYTTGAWHMDYNFVDDNNRSDKRYIPQSIALLKEGIANNPNRWDLYFELGWTHYGKKLEDYAGSLRYIQLACQQKGVDPNTGEEIERPAFVDRALAHAYERVGDFKNSAAQWERSAVRAKELVAGGKKPAEFADQTAEATCKTNLSRLLIRMAFRNGDMAAYKKSVDLASTLSGEIPWAVKGIKDDYAKRAATNNPPRDTKKPINADLQVTWKRIQPKVLELKGKINLIKWDEFNGLASEVYTHAYQNNNAKSADKKEIWINGCRVYWLLCDENYNFVVPNSFNWEVDDKNTVVWDSIYVGGGTFKAKLDFSKNPSFYPFKAKKYKLIVWFSPLEPGCPVNVQDRIGWDGMCLTDKSGVAVWDKSPIYSLFPKSNNEGDVYKMKYKVIKKEFILNRDDIVSSTGV